MPEMNCGEFISRIVGRKERNHHDDTLTSHEKAAQSISRVFRLSRPEGGQPSGAPRRRRARADRQSREEPERAGSGGSCRWRSGPPDARQSSERLRSAACTMESPIVTC